MGHDDPRLYWHRLHSVSAKESENAKPRITRTRSCKKWLYPLLRERDAAVEDSDEHKAILARLDKLSDEHDNALEVAIEDYNSQPSE